VRKKTEKLRKIRKLERKNNWKNRTVKKNRLNLKKTGRFGFGFINLKLKKPYRTEPKPKKTWKNRVKPIWTGFYPKKSNRNRSVWTGFGFFLNFVWLLFFFIKTEPNKKWSPLIMIFKWDKLNDSWMKVTCSSCSN
jgi:hypothetical protein